MLNKLEEYQTHIYDLPAIVSSILDPRIKKVHLPESIQHILAKAEEFIRTLLKQEETVAVDSPLPIDVDSLAYIFHIDAAKRVRLDYATEGLEKDHLAQYLEQPPICYTECPLAWWERNKEAFPQLASLARDYLALQASSVPSEELFSQAASVVTKKRNRLSTASLRALLCLRSWMKEEFEIGLSEMQNLKIDIDENENSDID
ncbi:hypothetical protein RCL1_000523 [Eukaryota sp. TZLM3-RCL]